MQQLVAHAPQRLSLLPEPPKVATTRTEHELHRAWADYATAYAAALAIDHTHSRWTGVPESEKADLRAERMAKLERCQAAYLAVLERVQRNAARRAAKNQRAALKAQPQLRLFADAWPDEFTHIAERFPRRPFVSNNLKFGSSVRAIDQAAGFRYIQHDPPAYCHVMVIDYDAPDGKTPVHEIWKQRGMPKPTWIASTPGTLRGHIAYALATPVAKTSAARLKPLEYAAYVEFGLTLSLTGDEDYAGFLTKNPINESAWDVDWINPQAYSLKELASYLDLGPYAKKPECRPMTGLSRNVGLFNHTREWAYTAVSDYWSKGYEAWHEAVLKKTEGSNSFNDPLPFAEVKATAKSIAKWVWQRFTPATKAALVAATHTPAVQALRGRQKGAKTREQRMAEALAMLEAGQSLRTIAAVVGVNPQTVANWRDRAAKPPTPVAGLN